MKTNKRIHAFTLVEFSISMTISTTIVGLILLSFFYINQWNHKHYQSLLGREELFEFTTVFRNDLYRFERLEFDGASLSLSDNIKEVEYRFDNSWITRHTQSVTDTFQIKNARFNPKYLEEEKLCLFSIELEFIGSNFDTISFNIPVLKSTNGALNISYGN